MNLRIYSFYLRLFAAAAFVWVCASPILSQAMSLNDAVKDMAIKISKYLESVGSNEISIGSFSGQPQLAANSGLAISQQFESNFKELGIAVKRRAKIGLKGEYLVSNSDQAAIEIRCSVVDEFGDTITDITSHASSGADAHEKQSSQSLSSKNTLAKKIDEPADLAMITGATVNLSPRDSRSDHAEDILSSVQTPKYYHENNILFAEKGSPFGLQIVVDGKPMAIQDDEGLPFVDIPKTKTYELRAWNLSNHECAIVVSIDGLSVFHFSQIRDAHDQPRYKHYIIPPSKKGSPLIGWHKTNEIVDQFLVTEYSKSAAAVANIMPSDEKIGVINMQFSAAWNMNDPPPADEAATKGGNATGFGPPVGVKTSEVHKQIGRLRTSISVRYSK